MTDASQTQLVSKQNQHQKQTQRGKPKSERRRILHNVLQTGIGLYFQIWYSILTRLKRVITSLEQKRKDLKHRENKQVHNNH